MKKRTQIAAWVYIAVSTMAALGMRPAKASSVHFPRFGIHIGHGIMLMADTFIINVLIVAGWVLLIRKRAWAWWVLVAVYFFVLGRMIAEYVYHRYEFYLVLIIGLPSIFCFSILPLILLLKDKPQPDASTAALPMDGGPKPRTRIAAYIFAIISVVFFLSLLAFFGDKWRFAVAALPWAIEWPFWILMSRGRKWAWTVLAVMYSVIPFTMDLFYQPLFHQFAKTPDMPAPTLGGLIAGTLFYALITSGPPLAFLLTDRPSGWPEPRPEPLEPKPKVHGPRPRKHRRRY
jgi:hypothetical protein